MFYAKPKRTKSKKTIPCECWHCGKTVRVPNEGPLPAQHEIFCAACRRACGIPKPAKRS